jgi:hypothetical protein
MILSHSWKSCISIRRTAELSCYVARRASLARALPGSSMIDRFRARLSNGNSATAPPNSVVNERRCTARSLPCFRPKGIAVARRQPAHAREEDAGVALTPPPLKSCWRTPSGDVDDVARAKIGEIVRVLDHDSIVNAWHEIAGVAPIYNQSGRVARRSRRGRDLPLRPASCRATAFRARSS